VRKKIVTLAKKDRYEVVDDSNKTMVQCRHLFTAKDLRNLLQKRVPSGCFNIRKIATGAWVKNWE
jgi:hypothetical protein